MNKSIFEINSIKDRIICPICQYKASHYSDIIKCLNIKCGMEFPIINNIPILINEKDSIFSIENYINIKNTPIDRKNKTLKIKKYLSHFIPSLSNNLSSKRNFVLLQKLLSTMDNPKVLIIGGAEITSNTEMIFNENNTVIESDIYFGPRTQIIIDGHHIPFKNDSFDLVIYQAVLEHVADPYMCVKEAHRILKNNGFIYANTPFMQQVHMQQYDFTRFTYLGHRRLFRSFKEIDSGVFAGTGVALGWSIRYFVKSLTNSIKIRLVLNILISFLFFWLKYIDFLTIKNRGTYDGASGFYFIGEKSNTILADKELIKLFKGI